MKDKIKLLSIAAVFVLLICAGYSILSFKQTDLQSILKKESSKKDLFIDHNESRVCSIQYEAKDNRTEKIYFEFADKYIFDMESKFSVYYDSNYLMIDSFEYEVLKNNLIHTKCIEKGNAPASSYHGVISWYNKFNVAAVSSRSHQHRNKCDQDRHRSHRLLIISQYFARDRCRKHQ